MEFLKIDGSYGEGGGQIIRTAITLSCIRKKPIQIENIRKNRRIPGLRAQHLTGIRLLAKICNAKVKGLEIGSTSIEFHPNDVEDSAITENIGTAGSISLIFQVLIPSVSFSKKKLKLSITGGTDVRWSPTSNYTKFVLSEAYSRMGMNFSMDVKRRGYYPKGGGKIELEVFRPTKIIPINLLNRKTKKVNLYCSFSKISPKKIREQVNKTEKILNASGFSATSHVKEETAIDKGASLLLSSIDSDSIVGSDGLFDLENNLFPSSILNNFAEFNMGADDHLADMLVLPASLLNEMTVFSVNKITEHLETNLYVTSKITGCKYGIGKLDNGYEVRIVGDSDTSI